jgi:ubiquinone/menaquinone biosynthesis C-methylase UbiE
MTDDAYFEANRVLWDTRVGLHLGSKFYDVPGFLAGNSSLCGIETAEMGPVAGKSLLHLQCHFGQDTLSLARSGAEVTGVDFSPAAIAAARELADRTNLKAEFVQADAMELPASLDGRFDIVFTSFGTIGWLPDLSRWADGIRRALKPGGFFYMLEFHRFFHLFDERGELKYDYFHSEKPDEETVERTYADGLTHEPLKEFWWNHSLSDIFAALRTVGLNVSLFNEFPYSVYKLADTMVETAPGRWVYESMGEKIPYMFSIRAEAPLRTSAEAEVFRLALSDNAPVRRSPHS